MTSGVLVSCPAYMAALQRQGTALRSKTPYRQRAHGIQTLEKAGVLKTCFSTKFQKRKSSGVFVRRQELTADHSKDRRSIYTPSIWSVHREWQNEHLKSRWSPMCNYSGLFRRGVEVWGSGGSSSRTLGVSGSVFCSSCLCGWFS